MTPELFVPSVPWRLPALLELTAGLSRQRMRIPVTYVLDGHDDHAASVVLGRARSFGLKARVVRGGPGAGTRWRWVAAAADDVLALSLDDDLVPGPLYVQNTLAAWTRLQEPFSWCGSLAGSRQQEYVRMTAAPERDRRLDIGGAGGFCVPAKMLRGIDHDPAADRFFGPLGHDEALVSWWLAAVHRARLWRPRGAADVREHVLSHDPRSQWLAGQGRCPAFVDELEARGWPIPDPPPVDVYAQFRGKPLGARQ